MGQALRNGARRKGALAPGDSAVERTLLCLFIGVLVQLSTPAVSGAQLEGPAVLDLSQRETLPESELQPLLQEWDAGVNGSLSSDGSQMISRVSQYLREEEYEGWVILRYNNPEIVDRVVDLYIAEYQRILKALIFRHETADQSNDDGRTRELHDANYRYNRNLLAASLKRDGQKCAERFVGDPGRVIGVNEIDPMYDLCSVAESTFSPRLYDYVWSAPVKGLWAYVYLASVLPERMLTDLFSATNEEWMGIRPTYLDILRRREDGAGIELEDAFEVLELMERFHPEAIRSHRAEVIGFLKRYARHYAERETKGRLDDARDVGLRLKALAVLETLAQPEDIGLVKDLLRDIPELPRQKHHPDNPAASEQLRARGETLLTRLQSQ